MRRTLFRLLSNQAARLSCLALLCIGLSAHAESPDDLHFIIPGGEGGGWDLTARTVGQTLQEAGIVSRVSYNNLSGNSGGIAMSRLVNGPNEHPNTLMVNSTPIIVRSLSNIFDHTYQDLTPVVSLIGDYGALVVANDSDHQSFEDLVTAFKTDPFHVKFGGGSARGDLDNIVVASILREAVGKKPGICTTRLTTVAAMPWLPCSVVRLIAWSPGLAKPFNGNAIIRFAFSASPRPSAARPTTRYRRSRNRATTSISSTGAVSLHPQSARPTNQPVYRAVSAIEPEQ